MEDRHKYNSEIHHRRSIRLLGYDYGEQGYYFITVCTQNRECCLGKIADYKMILNPIGEMVRKCWLEIPKHYPKIVLDEFIVMPNHLHGIIFIIGDSNDNKHGVVGADPRVCPDQQIITGRPHLIITGRPQGAAPTNKLKLPDIIQRFKTLTTKKYIDGIKQFNWPYFNRYFWQRNYFEHIVRNEKSLNKIRDYIRANPANWDKDRNNLVNFN